jgi:hypothetical protein
MRSPNAMDACWGCACVLSPQPWWWGREAWSVTYIDRIGPARRIGRGAAPPGQWGGEDWPEVVGGGRGLGLGFGGRGGEGGGRDRERRRREKLGGKRRPDPVRCERKLGGVRRRERELRERD